MTPAQAMVSICIPAFRAVKFLPETLESVRAQTVSDWELIVVEDGSDDGTRAVVEQFALSVGQPVRYLRHERNLGLTTTRNTGIQAAEGDWIALLDADDIWLADHLRDCLECSAKTDADFVHGGSMLFDSDSGVELEVRRPDEAHMRDSISAIYRGDYIIQPSSVLLRKDLWRRVGGFNHEFQHLEDREMWLRSLRAGASIAYSGTETCQYRRHAGAMSREACAMAEAAVQIYKQHLDWHEVPKSLRRGLYFQSLMSAGRLNRREDPRRALEHFRAAFRVRKSLLPLIAVIAIGLKIDRMPLLRRTP